MSHATDEPAGTMSSDEETLKESKFTRAKSPTLKRSGDASSSGEKAAAGDGERVVEQSFTDESGEDATQWVTLNDEGEKTPSAEQPKRSVLKTKDGEENRDTAKATADGEKRGGRTIAFGAVHVVSFVSERICAFSCRWCK